MRSAHRLGLVGLLLGGVLGLSACTGGGAPAGSASPAGPTPADSGPSASSTPSVSPSATLDTLPAKECLTGDYSLVRFVAASDETYGTGEGGDVTVAFTDDGYTLTGAGRKPMQVTLAGTTAQLVVDGRAKGTYTLDGSTATFTTGTTSGSGTVSADGSSRRLTMEQVTNVIGLRGQGTVACTAQAMTITLATVRLELGRV